MVVEKYNILQTLFRKQTYAEYYMTLFGFADGLDASELYNLNRPAHIPPGARFRDHVSVMKELGVGADRGDTLLKQQRQAVRDLSEIDMEASVSYMRTIAIDRRDPTILHVLALPLKDDHLKATHKALLPQFIPIHLEVRHLKGYPRAIVIMGSHYRNGGPYLINMCKGEPVSEASWYDPGGRHKTCRRIIMKDLESANKYYIRMRTDGPEGPGEWSVPVSIIVL